MAERTLGLRRELGDIARAATPAHLHLRERLVRIALVTLGVDAVGTLLGYLFERNANGTEIHTLGSAWFWATTQLLTVSSQIKNPISAPGRVLDVFLEAWAITIVATLAGAFGSFFYRRSLERHPMERRP